MTENASKPTALLLGAGSKLGNAIATALHRSGYRLLLQADSKSGQLPSIPAAVWFDAPVLPIENFQTQLQTFIKSQERLDAVIWASESVCSNHTHHADENELRLMLERNLVAPLVVAKTILRSFIKRKAGRYLLSIPALETRSDAAQTVVSSIHYGLLALVKSLAIEWSSVGSGSEQKGILVNGLIVNEAQAQKSPDTIAAKACMLLNELSTGLIV